MESKLHYIQDALESYAVYKLTKLSEENGMSASNDSDVKFRSYKNYCEERNINSDMYKEKDGKVYIKMYDEQLPLFWKGLKEYYADCKFDFIDVEREFRNKNKKGDFLIKISGSVNKNISVSLKAYKGTGGVGRIQVCSGTFNSFITNFMFKKDGVGMFLDSNENRFRGSDKSKRDAEISRLGYGSMLPAIHQIDRILSEEIKPYFTYGKKAEWYQNIEDEWKEGHKKYGHKAIDLLLPELNKFSNRKIKERVINMIGFDGEEELLLIASQTKDKMIDSITNRKLKDVISKVRSDKTTINYYKHGKNINFDFVDGQEVVLSIEVPFCLDKNGGWFLPKNKKGCFYPKENMYLEYGQRRPKKSKEINTSTNTYVNLRKALS